MSQLKQLELITEWNGFKEGDRIAHKNAPNTAIATVAEITQGKVFLRWDSAPNCTATGFPKFRFIHEYLKVKS